MCMIAPTVAVTTSVVAVKNRTNGSVTIAEPVGTSETMTETKQLSRLKLKSNTGFSFCKYRSKWEYVLSI